ncbi:unnamed protein product [Mortierella alpina]
MLVKSVMSVVGMVAATMAMTASAAAPRYGGYNDFNCKPSPAHPNPLILLHGMGGISLEFAYLGPRFAIKGYCVFALDYGHVEGIPVLGGLADIMVSGQEVSNFVDRVLKSTRASKVDFLGHSEGSTLMRVYVKYFNGVSKTGALTAIGSNQYGTELGNVITFLRKQNLWNGVEDELEKFCKPCVQLTTNSSFLQKLNEGSDTYPGLKYLMLASK